MVATRTRPQPTTRDCQGELPNANHAPFETGPTRASRLVEMETTDPRIHAKWLECKLQQLQKTPQTFAITFRGYTTLTGDPKPLPTSTEWPLHHPTEVTYPHAPTRWSPQHVLLSTRPLDYLVCLYASGKRCLLTLPYCKSSRVSYKIVGPRKGCQKNGYGVTCWSCQKRGTLPWPKTFD